jgi:NSS family neurotransmitter:Na+ symporter
MLAGLFFAISIIPYGVKKFREENLNHENSNIRIGRIWDFIIVVLAPAQMIFLLIWFFYSSWTENPITWLKPFDPDNLFNVGTIVVQWTFVLVILILANNWLVKRTSGSK